MRCLVAVILLCAFSSCATADDDPEEIDQQSQVKAGLIYNFINFSRWPDSTAATQESKYTICFLGDHPYQQIFNSVGGATIHGKALEFISLNDTDLSDENCHVLVFHASYEGNPDKTLQALSSYPVLTISEKQSDQAMISLRFDKKTMSFNVNQDAATKAGISFSARMLRLAASIKEAGS
jgi:hypothetical protein